MMVDNFSANPMIYITKASFDGLMDEIGIDEPRPCVRVHTGAYGRARAPACKTLGNIGYGSIIRMLVTINR